jgi:hypothetical protein
MFDAMLKVAGVQMLDINEAKDDSSLVSKVQDLESKVNETQERLVEARREADKYLKAGVILEMKDGLSMLEAEKFEKLAEMVTFSRDESFVESLETIKESILDHRKDKELDESFGKLPETAYVEKKVDVKAATDFSAYI